MCVHMYVCTDGFVIYSTKTCFMNYFVAQKDKAIMRGTMKNDISAIIFGINFHFSVV